MLLFRCINILYFIRTIKYYNFIMYFLIFVLINIMTRQFYGAWQIKFNLVLQSTLLNPDIVVVLLAAKQVPVPTS